MFKRMIELQEKAKNNQLTEEDLVALNRIGWVAIGFFTVLGAVGAVALSKKLSDDNEEE